MKRITALIVAGLIAAPIHAKTIATVNGQDISQEQLDGFVSLLVSQGATDNEELRNQVKQELIHRTAAVQAAEKAGIDKQPEVRQELELARQGILVRALMQDYLEKNPVSDADIKAEYDAMKKAEGDKKEYKVRHILIEDEDEAKKILADLKAKKVKFEDAAKEHSIDPGSGSRGGELGWAQADNYVPEFAKAVENQKKGELSDTPVKSQFGWHIVQVDDSRDLEFPELDAVKPQITEMLRQKKLSDFQNELMEKADVKEQ